MISDELDSAGRRLEIVDYVRDLALLEDSDTQRDWLRTRLEDEGFNVLTPSDREECLVFLGYGCRTFLLDIDLGGGPRKIEGLATLEDIKKQCKDAFCVMVSGNPQYRQRASKFGADLFLGKTGEDLNLLVARLNELYLTRRFALKSVPTLEAVGRSARSEMPPTLNQVANELRGLFGIIQSYIDALQYREASMELVILEPGLRQMMQLTRQYGDGFGIAIRALRNAIRNHGTLELRPELWSAWMSSFEKLLKSPRLTSESAAELADELDEEGFATEPPGWASVADTLADYPYQEDDESFS